MMEEELGLIVENFDVPWAVGLTTAGSYLLFAFLPIIPYALLPPVQALPWSVGSSILVLFGLGAGRTFLTRQSPLKSGLEMMAIGLIAAVVGFGIGSVVGQL